MVATAATVILTMLLADWIEPGVVIALIPGATSKDDHASYLPWVEVLIRADASAEARIDMILTARSVVNNGVPVNFSSSPEITGPISDLLH